jgi:hypothetical protein
VRKWQGGAGEAEAPQLDPLEAAALSHSSTKTQSLSRIFSMLGSLGLQELPPSGELVTESVAKLIVAQWACSYRTTAVKETLAKLHGTSFSTVDRIIKEYEATGTARQPRMGQGRKFEGPQYVFAGPRKYGNIQRLEAAVVKLPTTAPAKDVHRVFMEDGHGGEPSLSLIKSALLTMQYSDKQLTKRARERDDAACDNWMANMLAKYSSHQLVFIDETYALHTAHALACTSCHSLTNLVSDRLPLPSSFSTPPLPSLLPSSLTGMRITARPTDDVGARGRGHEPLASSSFTVARHTQRWVSSPYRACSTAISSKVDTTRSSFSSPS